MTGIPSENLKNQRYSERRDVRCAVKSDGGGSCYIITSGSNAYRIDDYKSGKMKRLTCSAPTERPHDGDSCTWSSVPFFIRRDPFRVADYRTR